MPKSPGNEIIPFVEGDLNEGAVEPIKGIRCVSRFCDSKTSVDSISITKIITSFFIMEWILVFFLAESKINICLILNMTYMK